MKQSRQIILIVLAIIILYVTLLVPKSVSDKSEMASLKLGYPLSFVTQDVSIYDPPSFPWTYGLQSIHQFPAQILWLNGIISFIIILGILELASYSLQKKS